jgi:chromosome segregation ATPase
MSETKRIKKDDILKALPAGFKTIDELAKILAESDIAKRKEDLKSWYVIGEGLQSLPADQQDIMFAKSKDYPKYLSEVAEIDKSLSHNTKAFSDSLLLYFKRLTERERASFEKKMKEVGDKAQDDERIMRENRDYLVKAQAREAEIVEKGKRYDAELERISAYEASLKKRAEELDNLHSDLEIKMGELNEKRKSLKERESAVEKQEQEYGLVAKEISDALTYSRMLKTVVGPKIEGFHTMLDEMATYFQNALKKLPNSQVTPAPPAKKAEDDLLMPGPDAGATMLGFGDLPPKKK